MTRDSKSLEELRDKYSNVHGGQIYDEKFRKVAEHIFSASGTRSAPYSGIPTLLDAPSLVVAEDEPDFGDLQVALLGVPMDLGVTNRNGSRFDIALNASSG